MKKRVFVFSVLLVCCFSGTANGTNENTDDELDVLNREDASSSSTRTPSGQEVHAALDNASRDVRQLDGNTARAETNASSPQQCVGAQLSSSEVRYEDARVLALWLCRTDRQCAQRFFIDRRAFDRKQFYYFFDRFVAEQQLKSYIRHNLFDDRVKDLFVRTMRMASFCTENEVPDIGDDGVAYCVCRNGKVCHEAAADAFSFDVVSLNFLCVAVVMIVIYYSALHQTRFRVIYENVMRLEREKHQLHKQVAHAKQRATMLGDGDAECAEDCSSSSSSSRHAAAPSSLMPTSTATVVRSGAATLTYGQHIAASSSSSGVHSSATARDSSTTRRRVFEHGTGVDARLCGDQNA